MPSKRSSSCKGHILWTRMNPFVALWSSLPSPPPMPSSFSSKWTPRLGLMASTPKGFTFAQSHRRAHSDHSTSDRQRSKGRPKDLFLKACLYKQVTLMRKPDQQQCFLVQNRELKAPFLPILCCEKVHRDWRCIQVWATHTVYTAYTAHSAF